MQLSALFFRMNAGFAIPRYVRLPSFLSVPPAFFNHNL
jgi:hypothetical protein